MKGNLELRPGEQLRHPLHPWNRPHLSLSGGFTRWDGFPSSWAARAFGRVAHHSPPGRSRPRSSADLTDSRTKKSAGMNGSSLVAHFPCAFPRAFLWGSELRAFWLCCYGLNEQVCFYPFFFFFLPSKPKKVQKLTGFERWPPCCQIKDFVIIKISYFCKARVFSLFLTFEHN